MNINFRSLWLMIVVLPIYSCEKVETIETDTFIFGHFNGFCLGESCIETYKIEDETLYEDTMDKYKGTDGFDFVALPQEKYEEVMNLNKFIPSQLWSESDKAVFGCPDCYDQGGILIQMVKSNTIKSWFFDKDISSNPAYIQDFLEDVNDKIMIINK